MEGKSLFQVIPSKCLQPTFLHVPTTTRDGEIDTEGDLESILDEMLGAGVPERILNLHYRSLQESLIAFSNDRYYGNSLITFPGPDVGDRALSLRRIEGFYARGGARHNEGEEKAIADEIVCRLRHEDEEVRKRSIGVVTFNSEQQTLIEDLLDDARSRYREIEQAFSQENTDEPVFVKNLETVQGDERDTILFSVTYGPDRAGHVTMNFGPLNRQGGERRLNVAITRARRRDGRLLHVAFGPSRSISHELTSSCRLEGFPCICRKRAVCYSIGFSGRLRVAVLRLLSLKN